MSRRCMLSDVSMPMITTAGTGSSVRYSRVGRRSQPASSRIGSTRSASSRAFVNGWIGEVVRRYARTAQKIATRVIVAIEPSTG